MRTFPRRLMALAIGVSLWLAGSARANLIVNGDFSAGNTGFSSSYTHYTGPTGSSSTFGPNNYAVDTNPIAYNPNFGFSVPDHTTGTGMEMIFDGSTSSNVVAWSETIPVTPNTLYAFSYWTSAWGNDNHNGLDPFPPKLLATANGGVIRTTFSLSAQDGLWQNFTDNFNSGSSSSVTLAITDTVTNLPGNDFVLDDISLNATPEPAGAMLVAAGAVLAMRRRRKQV